MNRLLAVTALLLLALASPAAAACATTSAVPTAASAAAARGAVECLVNEQRTQNGLRPLRVVAALRRAAVAHVGDMVSAGYFAHDSPSGSTPGSRAAAAGFQRPTSYWLVGEDLAWKTGASATPAAVVAAWMASPPHREEILRPQFRALGVGLQTAAPVATDPAAPAVTVAAEFGVRSRTPIPY